MRVYYMSFRFNGYFVTGATLMGGRYRTYIISGVGHIRLDSIVLLVLWMVVVTQIFN
jgi:hypothetical protein